MLKSTLKSWVVFKLIFAFLKFLKTKWLSSLIIILIVASFSIFKEYNKARTYKYYLLENSRYIDELTIGRLINNVISYDSITFINETGLSSKVYSNLKHIVNARNIFRFDWMKFGPNDINIPEVEHEPLKLKRIGNYELTTSKLISKIDLENSLLELLENSQFIDSIKSERKNYLNRKKDHLYLTYKEALVIEEEDSSVNSALSFAWEKTLFDINYGLKNTNNITLFNLSNPVASGIPSLKNILLNAFMFSALILGLRFLINWFTKSN